MKLKHGEIFLISDLKIHIKENNKGRRVTEEEMDAALEALNNQGKINISSDGKKVSM